MVHRSGRGGTHLHRDVVSGDEAPLCRLGVLGAGEHCKASGLPHGLLRRRLLLGSFEVNTLLDVPLDELHELCHSGIHHDGPTCGDVHEQTQADTRGTSVK